MNYNEKNKTKKHWIVLTIVTMLFAAGAGILMNVIGVFYTPVSEDLGILRGDFALHQTIMSLTMGFASLIVPKGIKKLGLKKSIIIGLILSVIGIAGMSLTNNVLIFYILGAIRGFGVAFYAMVPMATIINNWFEEKNGLAMSIGSGFSGLIGMIFAPIFSSLISKYGWRMSFVIMGGVILLFGLPAILIKFSLTPEEEGLLAYGAKEAVVYKDSKDTNNTSATISGVLKISFISMIIFSLLHTNILGINQHFSSYGESLGMSLKFSGYMISAVMFGNLFFKTIIGALSDKIGSYKTTIIMNIVNVIGLIIIILSKNHYLNIFAVFLFGSAFSVGSVALPLLSKDFFGRVLSQKVFPILSFISSVGVAISNTLVGYIYDFTGSYNSAFIFAVVFQVINFILIFIAYKNSINKLNKNN